MAIEIVDFPINSMVIFNSYVKLQEGNGYLVNSGIFHSGIFFFFKSGMADTMMKNQEG